MLVSLVLHYPPVFFSLWNYFIATSWSLDRSLPLRKTNGQTCRIEESLWSRGSVRHAPGSKSYRGKTNWETNDVRFWFNTNNISDQIRFFYYFTAIQGAVESTVLYYRFFTVSWDWNRATWTGRNGTFLQRLTWNKIGFYVKYNSFFYLFYNSDNNIILDIIFISFNFIFVAVLIFFLTIYFSFFKSVNKKYVVKRIYIIHRIIYYLFYSRNIIIILDIIFLRFNFIFCCWFDFF